MGSLHVPVMFVKTIFFKLWKTVWDAVHTLHTYIPSPAQMLVLMLTPVLPLPNQLFWPSPLHIHILMVLLRAHPGLKISLMTWITLHHINLYSVKQFFLLEFWCYKTRSQNMFLSTRRWHYNVTGGVIAICMLQLQKSSADKKQVRVLHVYLSKVSEKNR